MASRIFYSAVNRFDSTCGEFWHKFIQWSHLTQLRQVISLDGILCPTFFQELTDEDWRHNVQEDNKITLFHGVDYVLGRVARNDRVNVLALMHEPDTAELCSFVDPRFVFRGFDLVDGCGGISALVNCGGFDKAFSPTDISDYGLLTNHGKARRVQKLLRDEYPDEHHAICELWAIWEQV